MSNFSQDQGNRGSTLKVWGLSHGYRAKKSSNYAEAYKLYAAQVISQIDEDIAEKGHFWMETS